jgi:choline dehydrogenase-like flavoprotein
MQTELLGRVIRHPRGKLLGGSSAINSHALIYPSQSFFTAWEGFGNPHWDWSTIRQYYQKFQTIEEPLDEVKKLIPANQLNSFKQVHDGHIRASYPATISPQRKAWVAAHEYLGQHMTGIEHKGDCFGGGITSSATNQKNRERSHAGAYLSDALHRPNLTLALKTMVTGIVLHRQDSKKYQAKGVRVSNSGRNFMVSCSKEVIVCAGAFQSPQLLELSGIGDQNRLSSLGIPVLYNNPSVGENLQDHINCAIAIETEKAVAPIIPYDEQLREYRLHKTGPMIETAASFAYHSLHPFQTDVEQREVSNLVDAFNPTQSLSYPAQSLHFDYIKSQILSPQEATATSFMVSVGRLPANVDGRTLDTRTYFSFIAMLAHPLSRGTCHISTASPMDKPDVDFKYLTHPLDGQILARHLIAFERLLTTPAMAAFAKPDGEHYTAGSNVSDAITYIRENARTNYHPCGTCAMMSEELGGVVDSHFRVYGTKGLRVVDASVFPIIPRGNILTTVYAVAERAGDVIKADLGFQGGI